MANLQSVEIFLPQNASLMAADTREDFLSFAQRPEPLAVKSRPTPNLADNFFDQLLPAVFTITGKVRAQRARADIDAALKAIIPDELRRHPFYDTWAGDLAEASTLFAAMLGEEAVSFTLSTQRGCRRYHQDRVPMRLLVTYAGQGTEWLPDHAADRAAYENGGSNETIVRDPSALQWVDRWDIAVFKGSPTGLLHRTPDGMDAGTSLLMRLDAPTFYDHLTTEQDV